VHTRNRRLNTQLINTIFIFDNSNKNSNINQSKCDSGKSLQHYSAQRDIFVFPVSTALFLSSSIGVNRNDTDCDLARFNNPHRNGDIRYSDMAGLSTTPFPLSPRIHQSQ
jgi:hypothetical protein